MSDIQVDKTKGYSVPNKCELLAEIHAVQSQVCMIRSTYLPNSCTTVLKVRLQLPFAAGQILLFEPMQGKVTGLEMPEALLTQEPNGGGVGGGARARSARRSDAPNASDKLHR